MISKKDTDEFVGHVILGHGDEPGQSELAGLSLKHHWRSGYGVQAGTAVVREYAPAIVMEGFLLDGKALERITATARTDNKGSVGCLEKYKMRKVSEEVKYGATRYNYQILLSELTILPTRV